VDVSMKILSMAVCVFVPNLVGNSTIPLRL
jgi:hypothetical protein